MTSASHEVATSLLDVAISFSSWIHQSVDSRYDAILFCSREGAFFKRTFEYIADADFKTPVFHLEISRRSLSVPLISSEEDIKELIIKKPTRPFKLSTLLNKRFGLKEFTGEDRELCDLTKDEVCNLVLAYKEQIISNACSEKVNLGLYFEKTGLNLKGKKVAVIDIGYNGTSQSYLDKCFPDALFFGFYLFTFNNIRNILCNGCYDSFVYHELNNISVRDSITRNIALLELLFTIGKSSVSSYDEKGTPVYSECFTENSFVSDIQSLVFEKLENNEYRVLNRFDTLKLLHSILATPTKKIASLFINARIEDDFGLGRFRYILSDPGSKDFSTVSEWKEGADILIGNSKNVDTEYHFFETIRRWFIKGS